ncbi:MAG TPA: BON domain-containing protein, partial [Thermoanaerobaculia bacterium]|nr:BON domain-containing protein [Thermoanaerobaculia bacterium]
MGFFEFIKDAGAKVFAHEPEPAPAAHAAPETNPLAEQFRQRRQAALLKLVSDLQLEVEGLRVELEGDRVTVFGKVASQAEREKVVLALGNVHGVAGVDDRLEVAAAAPEAKLFLLARDAHGVRVDIETLPPGQVAVFPVQPDSGVIDLLLPVGPGTSASLLRPGDRGMLVVRHRGDALQASFRRPDGSMQE